MDEWAEKVTAAATQAGGDSGWAIMMAAEVQDINWQKLETDRNQDGCLAQYLKDKTDTIHNYRKAG